MIGELGDLQSRSRVTTAGLDFTASGRKTKRLIHAENVSKTLGGKLLFDGLDLTLLPGVRVGLAVETVRERPRFLRLLMGAMPQDSGTIERADQLKVVYFDQNRDSLDPKMTLRPRTGARWRFGDLSRHRDSRCQAGLGDSMFQVDALDMPVEGSRAERRRGC